MPGCRRRLPLISLTHSRAKHSAAPSRPVKGAAQLARRGRTQARGGTHSASETSWPPSAAAPAPCRAPCPCCRACASCAAQQGQGGRALGRVWCGGTWAERRRPGHARTDMQRPKQPHLVLLLLLLLLLLFLLVPLVLPRRVAVCGRRAAAAAAAAAAEVSKSGSGWEQTVRSGEPLATPTGCCRPPCAPSLLLRPILAPLRCCAAASCFRKDG